MAENMGKTAVAGLSIGVVALTISAFDVVLPPVFEVSGQPPSMARTQLVRAHVINAAVVAGLLGIGASAVAKSPAPILAAVAAVAWLSWQYDAAARRMPPAA